MDEYSKLWTVASQQSSKIRKVVNFINHIQSDCSMFNNNSAVQISEALNYIKQILTEESNDN